MGDPSRDELVAALREELVLLWSDLATAFNRSLPAPGTWSIECLNLAERIQAITRLVGPVSWGEVPYTLFAPGVDAFERVHAEIGVTVPPEDVQAGREFYIGYMRPRSRGLGSGPTRMS